MTFFQAFLDVLFLYGGQRVWGSSTPRSVFILEIQVFWRKKTKKSHNFSVLALFDIEDPILDCSNVSAMKNHGVEGSPFIQGGFYNWASPDNVSRLPPLVPEV